MALTAPADRAEAVVRQKWLTAANIGWNSIEGVVAIVAGVAAGSVSLIGFGLDSGIEVSEQARTAEPQYFSSGWIHIWDPYPAQYPVRFIIS